MSKKGKLLDSRFRRFPVYGRPDFGHSLYLQKYFPKMLNFPRLAFANENLEQILNSANHPFDNVESCWWIDSDEPWQTLAACIEIRNALSSPCPEQFVSHLPINQVHGNLNKSEGYLDEEKA